MLSDARHALRSLAKSPGYSVIALLTLALGIGVNTAMFSVVDAMLFRAGPFPHPEQLVQVMARTRQGDQRSFSDVELREIRTKVSSFESLTTIGRPYFALSQPGEPAERAGGITASADFFRTFGIHPLIGREFTSEEAQPGRDNVVLLSYWFWQQRYGGRADVLGQSIRLDGLPVTIIGVMPPTFDYRMLWGNCAFFRPLAFTKEQTEWRDYRVFSLIGRLKPGVTAEQAAAELAPVAAMQEKQNPQSYSGLGYRAIPLARALMDGLGRQIVWMLMALSGFVLAIACANLANLQLARATAGMRDLAIRAALGASRARLIVQQLTESIIVALAGGTLGILVAIWVNRLLEQAFQIDGVPGIELPINGKVLGLTIAASVLTGLAFGLLPAWLTSQTDVSNALKAQARGSTTGRSHHRVRQALIVGEVALALVLLGGAAVMQRGFARLLDRESGWDTNKVLTAVLPIPETRFGENSKRVELFRKLEARLTALPGVEHAAIATSIPLFSYSGDRPVLVQGETAADLARLPTATHTMVTSDFFATLGIPLLEGRLFAPDVKASGPPVVIVNEKLAKKLWPTQGAVGQRLGSIDSGTVYWAEVIGVVRDVDPAGAVTNPSTLFQVYKPLVQEPWSWVYLVVRSATPATLGQSLRRAVAEVDPDLPADQVGTVVQLVDQAQHNIALASSTLTSFAILGVLLAAVGLYGVISSLVVQRMGEFGIRLALGATPGGILRLVIRHGVQLSLLGLSIGAVGAFTLGRFLSAIMPRLVHPDPVTLSAVALLLFLVAILASFIPARRATKVDPLSALRAE